MAPMRWWSSCREKSPVYSTRFPSMSTRNIHAPRTCPAFRHVILIPLYSMVSSNPMISMLSLVFAMSPSS